MGALHLKFDANEREEFAKMGVQAQITEFDYEVKGSLEQTVRALVRLGLVSYV